MTIRSGATGPPRAPPQPLRGLHGAGFRCDVPAGARPACHLQRPPRGTVTLPFIALGLRRCSAASLVARFGPGGGPVEPEYEAKNPLEVRSAFLFAGVFLAIMVVTKLVVERFGTIGIVALAALMGVSDVDPFIMGLTQRRGRQRYWRRRLPPLSWPPPATTRSRDLRVRLRRPCDRRPGSRGVSTTRCDRSAAAAGRRR